MIEDLINQIQKAKAEYTEEISQHQLDTWEKELKENGAKLSALQLEVVKTGLLQWANKIRENKKLLVEPGLTDQQIVRMFAENKVYEEVINYFINPKLYIDYVAAELKKLT